MNDVSRLPQIDPNAPDHLDPTVHERAIGFALDCFGDLLEGKPNPAKIVVEAIKHCLRSREQKALIDAHRKLRRVVSILRDVDSQIFVYAFDNMDMVHIEALLKLHDFSTTVHEEKGFSDYLDARAFDRRGHSVEAIMLKLSELGLVQMNYRHERWDGGPASPVPDPRFGMQHGNVWVTPWFAWKATLTVTGKQVVALYRRAYDLALGLPVSVDS